jgi:rhamnose utilization protein RhaD (predicted bifunctional aldolase and dehydrogenase)
MSRSRSDTVEFCKEIGCNSSLVQGAGGNISWKDKEILWIKASGMRLSDAEYKDIFTPVNLAQAKKSIDSGVYNIKSDIHSTLKPSIETSLHIIMPHKFVLHIHPVDILAILVQKECEKGIKKVIGDSLNYIVTPYVKPGPKLAKCVHELVLNGATDVILMKNHGIVIGGDSIKKLSELLKKLTGLFKTRKPEIGNIARARNCINAKDYTALENFNFSQLVLSSHLYKHIKEDWALYPDHVVFLGCKSFCYDSCDDFVDNISSDNFPDLVFIKKSGVYVRPGFSKVKIEMLQCFFDILCRLPVGAEVHSLSSSQVQSLISWDAEKYRVKLNK